MEKPGHIVVRGHEQAGGIDKPLVAHQQVRVDMTMRADQRQVSQLLVKAPGNGPMIGVSEKESVWMQHEQGIRRSHLSILVPGVRPRNQRASTLREKP